MKILICLKSQFIAAALKDFLQNEKFECYMNTINDNNFMPDIILVDFFNLLIKWHEKFPSSKIVLIDTGLEKENVISAFLYHNIRGVICCNAKLSELEKAFEKIIHGEIYMDNNIIDALLNRIKLVKTCDIKDVTDREKQIIKFVCDGNTNKEIANRLLLSEQTIKAHLNKIFKKLNITSRSQLVAFTMKSPRN